MDIHIHPQPEAYPIDLGRVEVITVQCPVRGRGLIRRELTRAGAAELFAFFLALVERNGEVDLDSDSPLIAALVDLGFLVSEDDVFEWPRFAIPLPLPTGAAAEPATALASEWRVADTFLFQAEFALHPRATWPADYDEQEGRLRCFAGGPAFWLGDPAALATPYWVTPEIAGHLASLAPGAPPPPLPSTLAQALAEVGALVRDRPAAPAPSPLERARAGFADAGYAVVRQLLGAAELAALRRYYAALLEAGLIPFGDRQNGARFSMYNDPVGRFVHARLVRAMATVAAQPVEPSFSYFFSYVAGAELTPHKDRPQAELSISLQLDYRPAPAGATGWPLCFRFDDGRVAAADLARGDAVFYHGRALTHFRAILPPEHQSSHIVLEYVPRDFRGLRI